MATYRVHKQKNYTSMSNYHLDDPDLSLKAIGLLSYMLRLPDDWVFSTKWLAKQHKDGIDAIRSSLKELEAHGYVRRSQSHGEHGRFSATEFEVYERPPDAENAPCRDFPYTVEPDADLPHAVNPTLPNTKIDQVLTETNPPIAPQEGAGVSARRRKREAKEQPEHQPERFAKFWKAYPRKESKQNAIAAWDRLAPNDELLAVMARALAKQLKSDDWRRGIGIPYASTWINQHRWEDVPFAPQARTTQGTEGPAWYREERELWT